MCLKILYSTGLELKNLFSHTSNCKVNILLKVNRYCSISIIIYFFCADCKLKNLKKLPRESGATFWPESFRTLFCTCLTCLVLNFTCTLVFHQRTYFFLKLLWNHWCLLTLCSTILYQIILLDHPASPVVQLLPIFAAKRQAMLKLKHFSKIIYVLNLPIFTISQNTFVNSGSRHHF